MKNLQFFQNFQENFAIISIFIEILSKFWRKFVQKIKKFKNILVGGSGGVAPRR